jgi:adenosylhomocysteine nucleosidase
MNESTIVMLTAMNLEYSAVRGHLSAISVHTHPMGTRFEVGRLDGCRVALALTGKGNQSAAVLAERATAEFDPAAIVFVGVAGALQPHLGLGDVVVATHVYAYHGATSQDDGVTARPRTWELSHRAHQIAAHLERTGDWTRQSPAPRVHFGPVAAGEIAHYSAVSDARQWLREHYSDAVAVEMEAAGVAQAGHLNDALPTIMVRGISDYADPGKTAEDDAQWQPRAATNAAAFGTHLAVLLAAELDHGRRPSSGPGAAQPGRSSHSNYAAKGAHVGVQGESVTIHGDIHLAGPSHDAGSASITAGPDSLTVSPGRLRRALDRARNVVRGFAELAAGVAAIVTACRSVL